MEFTKIITGPHERAAVVEKITSPGKDVSMKKGKLSGNIINVN